MTERCPDRTNVGAFMAGALSSEEHARFAEHLSGCGECAAETVELYRLAGEVYPPVAPQKDGVLTSEVVPGFRLPVRAVFDEAVNLAALREILEGQ